MTTKGVRNFLKSSDAVIFVGSGISCAAGLPTWSGLLEELALFLEDLGEDPSLVRREVARGDLLQAASYGFDKLTVQTIGDFIRKATRLGSAEPCSYHHALVSLPASCFITTNYDNLIEQALLKWRKEEFFRPPVTNKHLAELADILNARSSHFVFKPHGDASDSDSIILTREQYRTLLPGGERNRTLEALKTLLVTRPVLYVGFGLRDPDFLYIRDILLNTYQGANRDHYALVPNITSQEADYWRKHYGIRLVNYDARQDANGRLDHSNLLALLEDLDESQAAEGVEKHAVSASSNEARILALLRYSAGLVRAGPSAPAIPMFIDVHDDRGDGLSEMWGYGGWEISRFLSGGPSRSLLLGPPGSGKSFSLRTSVAALAKRVQEACMEEGGGSGNAILPVYVDLKLYQGDLLAQINAQIPASFDIKELIGPLKLKLFLDAYNEQPLEYIENSSLLKDLDSLTEKVGEFDYVISSRSIDGLEGLSAPTYEISHFDDLHVEAALAANGVLSKGKIEQSLRQVLRRPFFLGLVKDGLVDIEQCSSLRDILSSYASNLEASWQHSLSTPYRLSEILARLAHRALSDGREAFPSAWLSDELSTVAPAAAMPQGAALNWLIARGVLTAHSGSRISFVHQSITEYFASLELIRLNSLGTFNLRSVVALRRWDQCLFLALSMMDAQEAQSIISYLVKADISLAFSAVRFAENNYDEALSLVLRAIADQPSTRAVHSIPHTASQLRYSPQHVPLLEQLVERRGSIGGFAVQALARTCGEDFVERLFLLLRESAGDYNFIANGIVPALQGNLKEGDLKRLVDILVDDTVEDDSDRDESLPIEKLLAQFDPDSLLQQVQGRATVRTSGRVQRTIAYALSERTDRRSFELLLDLTLAGNTLAPFALYSRIEYGSETPDEWLAGIGDEHLDSVWKQRRVADFWADFLRVLSQRLPHVASRLSVLAGAAGGIERIALLSCLTPEPKAATLRTELKEFSSYSEAQLAAEPLEIFDLCDLDWSGAEELYLDLLTRKNVRLAKSLLGGALPPTVHGIGRISIAPAQDILDWITDIADNNNDTWWLRRQIGSLLARCADEEARELILTTLENGLSGRRGAIKSCVLDYCTDLSTDDLGEGAISYLLADLSVEGRISRHFHNPLGHLATEQFVTERLLPLAHTGSKTFERNLRIVLDAAGGRHARRYLLPSQ